MTKAPDRIWLETCGCGLPKTPLWTSLKKPEWPTRPYLLSTPAREAAGELLEALELLAGHEAFCDPQYNSLQLNERLDKARAAISKVKEGAGQ